MPTVATGGETSDIVPDVEPASTPPSRRPATVVVIDDNEANLDLLRRVLAMRPGIRAVFARDGAEGLALVPAEAPDLVLLDLHLPLIDGGEVLRRIKADPATAHVSVVVLSGVADAETIRRTRDDGADGYLTKPFDVHELLDLTDRLLAALVQVGAGSADAVSDEVLAERARAPRRAKQVEAMHRDVAVAEATPWRPLSSAAVGHLAHDLRGCIHVIRGHAELLRAEATDQQSRESAALHRRREPPARRSVRRRRRLPSPCPSSRVADPVVARRSIDVGIRLRAT